MSLSAVLRKLRIAWIQFRRFQKWGIVPEPSGGLYPPDTIERIRTAYELWEQGVRPLHRRALRLYILGRDLPAEKVLEAIRRTAEEMERKQPRTKLKQLAKVLDQYEAFAREQLPQHLLPEARTRWSDLLSNRKLRESWRQILSRARTEDLQSEEFRACLYLLFGYLPRFPKWEEMLQRVTYGEKGFEFPEEERLVLFFAMFLARKRLTARMHR